MTTDSQKIALLEKQVAHLNRQVEALNQAVIRAGKAAKASSVEEAVGDLQHSIALIYKHGNITGTSFNFAKRHHIETV